jgi:beta-mannosidase
MTTIRDLSSTGQRWSIIDCSHRWGDEKALEASAATWSPAGWLPATVPGLVAQDLLRAGRIPDPFYGDNVQHARWIEERDWLYRTVIRISADEAARPSRLVCESLDTFVTLYLNGERIASHENQFRRLFVDLTGKLKVGDNVLVLSFEASWPATVRRAGPKLAYWNDPWERLYVRKSQMSYGWDWAARTPTVGICDPIRIEFADGVWASDLWVRGKPAADGSGTISVQLDVVSAGCSGELTAELTIDGAVVAAKPVGMQAGQATTIAFEHRLAKAKLWWPKELGEPHLHRVGLRLKRGASVVHEAQARCGIRDIALVLKDPASPNGNVFYFTVNGVRLWAKGDNWLPIDFLHTRVTEQQYRDYLGLLMAGGVNCIRVWGGGIVEHAPFYDLCDELGLVIWHDFGYACGIYPRHDAFMREAALETEDIVKRLRSHPSIALWCGNNENEALAMAVKAPPEDRFHPLYYDVIAKVVTRCDPDRPYHPGSPASPSGKTHPDSMDEGDRHNWDVWFGWKRTDWIGDQARFNSEFGAQAFPQLETLQSFMHPDGLWTQGAVSHPDGPSPGYLFARHGAQLDKLVNRAADFGTTHSINALIATTQTFQADTIGRYVRHYKRLLPVSGGVVLWNYTATWPSICWAAVDWYRRPKHAYYECKRCFRPAIVGIEPVDAEQRAFAAYVSHDRPGTISGEVVLELREIASGKVIAREATHVALADIAAREAVRIAVPAVCDRRRHAFVARFRHGEVEERDFRYLVPIAQVEGTGGKLTVERRDDSVRIRCEGWRMRVGVEAFESPAIWDDNYFDMMPGDERILRIAFGAMPDHLWAVADMGARKPLVRGEATEIPLLSLG